MTETELQFSKVRCYGIYEKIGRSDGIGDPLKPPFQMVQKPLSNSQSKSFEGSFKFDEIILSIYATENEQKSHEMKPIYRSSGVCICCFSI